MKSVDELIENGYVKVGNKSYCEYWKKGEEVITIPTDAEYYDGCDQEEYFEDDDEYEEYELSQEDFAKLKSYEVSNGIYKYNSIEHLKEILSLLDSPYIDNLETDLNSGFKTDLSKLKFDYGLICSYGYMDSRDELVNCCMIIDGGRF
ncbi:MAG: hypothetical protein RR623_00235 [Bacilli bacterium]